MTESVGTLIDRITDLEVQRWRTESVMLDPRAPVAMRHDCALRLRVIDDERDARCAELSELWAAISSHRRASGRVVSPRPTGMVDGPGGSAESDGGRSPSCGADVIPLVRRQPGR